MAPTGRTHPRSPGQRVTARSQPRDRDEEVISGGMIVAEPASHAGNYCGFVPIVPASRYKPQLLHAIVHKAKDWKRRRTETRRLRTMIDTVIELALLHAECQVRFV